MNRKVLIMVPHMPIIFNWVNADNLKLIKFFNDLSDLHNDFILKFHPRYSQLDEYKDLLNFPNFQLEQEENILELLNEADIVIAFETSSVLFLNMLTYVYDESRKLFEYRYFKRKDLFKHLHTFKRSKKLIPYVTSYYKRYWGFCLSHDQKTKLKEPKYIVFINSSFKE